MTREKLLGVFAAITFLAVQAVVIMTLSIPIQLKLLLLALLFAFCGAASLFLVASRRRLNKLRSATRNNRHELNRITNLLNENKQLTSHVRELERSRKQIIRQQTKLFDLILNTNENDAS